MLIFNLQAFHWCPDYDSASKEFARILKPNGVVAFIWNLEDRYGYINQSSIQSLTLAYCRDGAQWVAQIRDRYEAHEKGAPQFRLGLWRQTFDTPSYKKFFQPPEENQWEYTLPGTLEIVTNRAISKSYIAILPEEEKASVKADIKSIVEKGDGRVWRDEKAGEFEYPYKTYVVLSKKL